MPDDNEEIEEKYENYNDLLKDALLTHFNKIYNDHASMQRTLGRTVIQNFELKRSVVRLEKINTRLQDSVDFIKNNPSTGSEKF